MIRLMIYIVAMLIILLFLLLICIGLYLAYRRWKEVKKLSIKDAYIAKTLDTWKAYLLENKPFSATLIPASKEEIAGMEEIFVAYLKNLSNESILEKIKSFSNDYLYGHYRKRLKSKSWSNRMNAMFRIEDFQITRLQDDCKRLMEKKVSKEELFQLLRIMSLFNPALFLEKILDSSTRLSEYEYKRLLLSISPELLNILVKQFDELPPTFRYSLIDTMAVKRELEFLPYLEKNLNHSDTEVRVRTLKAIVEIGAIQSLSPYMQFVKSDVWEERLMVAKLLSFLSLSYTEKLLKDLLEDPVFLVRAQAAKSIMKDKQGKYFLEEYIKTSQDPYAIDMAYEVLRKGLV